MALHWCISQWLLHIVWNCAADCPRFSRFLHHPAGIVPAQLWCCQLDWQLAGTDQDSCCSFAPWLVVYRLCSCWQLVVDTLASVQGSNSPSAVASVPSVAVSDT